MTTSDPKEAVDSLLARAGLSVDPEEYALLLRVYPLIRAQTDSLRIPEARYAEPAMIYPAHLPR